MIQILHFLLSMNLKKATIALQQKKINATETYVRNGKKQKNYKMCIPHENNSMKQ